MIDPTKAVVYVVAWHDDARATPTYRYRLHALRLRDGTHLTAPVVIDAPRLNAPVHKQRAWLLLTVLNHMCTNNFRYPRFSAGDFHHAGTIQNSDDRERVENGALLGLDDLKQESPYVRGELWNFVVKTNNLGFDGYRQDAARHVPRWYWRDRVVNNLRRWGKYVFGEVASGNLDYVFSYLATGMAVTDYPLYFAMQNNFRLGGNLALLDGAGIAGRDGPSALTFVQNQDVRPPVNRMLAHAFIAAYPGYPAFFDVDLRDPALNNLIWIQNTLAAGPYVNRYKDGDTIVFSRGASLLAGINQKDAWSAGGCRRHGSTRGSTIMPAAYRTSRPTAPAGSSRGSPRSATS